MLINFDPEEALLVYGRIKNELNYLKKAQGIKIAKSELKLYENIISKFEEQQPNLKNLPL